MADVRDWAAFIRGRWNWTSFGYEKNFPRGCQFTDIDAYTNFDGRSLSVETKQWDGIGKVPVIPTGQLRAYKDAAGQTDTVLIVWGCACCNDPLAILNVGTGEFADLRAHTKPERRQFLSASFDKAMGLS